MTSRSPKRRPDAHDIASAIVERAMVEYAGQRRLPYVIRVSDPPTAQERLQLLAVRLQRSLVAIMSHRCETVEEGIARFESLGSY
jgi:hypothetical protein